MSPAAKPTSSSVSSLSRTKSGFLDTAKGKKKPNDPAQDSEDEADEEAQEDSSPMISNRKGLEPLGSLRRGDAAKAPQLATSGWAKTQSGVARKSSAASRKHGDAVMADLDEHSVASEDIDALEFSAGGGGSDSNGSFSFMNDDSIVSHRAKGVVKSGRSIPALKTKVNLSEESVDVEFSITEQETELSTSGQGLFEKGGPYDYQTNVLPPVGTLFPGKNGSKGW